jgi:hypothetical protein
MWRKRGRGKSVGDAGYRVVLQRSRKSRVQRRPARVDVLPLRIIRVR